MKIFKGLCLIKKRSVDEKNYYNDHLPAFYNRANE